MMIHYYSKVVFSPQVIYIMQQECINLIKSDINDVLSNFIFIKILKRVFIHNNNK